MGCKRGWNEPEEKIKKKDVEGKPGGRETFMKYFYGLLFCTRRRARGAFEVGQKSEYHNKEKNGDVKK